MSGATHAGAISLATCLMCQTVSVQGRQCGFSNEPGEGNRASEQGQYRYGYANGERQRALCAIATVQVAAVGPGVKSPNLL